MGKALIVLLSVLVLFVDNAFPIDFKQESILSDGKWVKIKVTETGIHELSYQQLEEFGFDNPEDVKVYGNGGNVASENYLARYMDDLEQTPVMHRSGKIYFYAKNAVKDSVIVAGTTYMYRPVTNPYSRYGIYFLTDKASEDPLFVQDVDYTVSLNLAAADSDSGTAIWYEEDELYNPGLTGQNFLGRSFVNDGEISYEVPVPGMVSSGTVYVAAVSALMSDAVMNGYVSVDGKDMELDSGNTLPANSSTDYLEYGNLTVKTKADANVIVPENGILDLNIRIETSGNLKKAWMDFVSVAYPAINAIPSDYSQTCRYIPLKEGKAITVYPSSPGFMVWKVDECKSNPEFPFKTENCLMDDNGDGSSSFIDNRSLNWAEYVLFDTEREQLHPEFVEMVDNQNLHAMSVPDMLIITNSKLIAQAERLADYHRMYDGMDVAVVDQELIFNEFSSGARDAMGYRRFCKMLYDRNPEKFRYLLLFGPGTYDNRMLYTGEESQQLISYQSKDSYSQVRSYSTDDFFGFLDDSNTSYTSRQMQIAVGRIPFATTLEMDSYIDKLVGYMSDVNNSSSVWKNNMLLIGENGDDDVHVSQCESFMRYFNATGNYDMNITKLYLKAFADEKTVRTKFVENMNHGQNFVLFVGHGNPYSMTKTQEIMNLDKARETHYKYAPVMYFSTCDVARYDRGGSNIVESLLLNEEGGIISAIASTRVVYTNLNGKLSDAFAKSLTKSDDYYDGEKTVGKVLLDAKNTCGERTINRLKYHLIGDPALNFTFPENKVTITKVNGETLSESATVSTALADELEIEGVVEMADGSIDQMFNGKALVQLYDSNEYYTTARVADDNAVSSEKDLEQRGALLNEAEFMIESGMFKGTFVVPVYSVSDNDVMPLRVVAISDDNRLCSGSSYAVVADRSAAPSLVSDYVAPEIKEFCINDKDFFKDGQEVDSDFMLYAEIYDNSGVNNSVESLATSMYVSFDGGDITMPVNGYYPVENNGGIIEMPVYGMDEGRHTVELVVTDFSGNIARKNLSFYVKSKADDFVMEISEKASSDFVEVDLQPVGNAGYSSAEIFVTDKGCNTVYRTVVDSFPYEWNLTDNDGNQLAPGVYDVTLSVDNYSLPSKKIVVLEQ